MDSSQSPDQNQSPEENQESNNSSSQYSPQNAYPIEGLNVDSASPNPQSSEDSKKNAQSNENSPPINYAIDDSAGEEKFNREIQEDENELKKSNENLDALNLLLQKEGKIEISKGSFHENAHENNNQDNGMENNLKIYNDQQNDSPDQNKYDEYNANIIRILDNKQIFKEKNMHESNNKQEIPINIIDQKGGDEIKNRGNVAENFHKDIELKEDKSIKRVEIREMKEANLNEINNFNLKNDDKIKDSEKTIGIIQKKYDIETNEEKKTKNFNKPTEKEFSHDKEGKIL